MADALQDFFYLVDLLSSHCLDVILLERLHGVGVHIVHNSEDLTERAFPNLFLNVKFAHFSELAVSRLTLDTAEFNFSCFGWSVLE